MNLAQSLGDVFRFSLEKNDSPLDIIQITSSWYICLSMLWQQYPSRVLKESILYLVTEDLMSLAATVPKLTFLYTKEFEF